MEMTVEAALDGLKGATMNDDDCEPTRELCVIHGITYPIGGECPLCAEDAAVDVGGES